MGRVGILETHSHEHIAYYLTAAACEAGHTVTCYFTEDIYERIDAGFNWPQAAAVEIVDDTQDAVETVLADDDLDVLSVNTVTGSLEEYQAFAALDPECAMIVWVYGANTWFGEQPIRLDGTTITPTEDDPWAVLAAYRQVILRHADAAIVELSPWKDWANEFGDSPVPVHHFPAVIARTDPPPPRPPTGKLTVSVPGAIRDRRRYSDVIDAVDELTDAEIEVEVRVPGRRVDETSDSVIEWAKDHPAVTWAGSDEYIPFDQYSDEIRRADVLVNPLVETVVQRGFEERMGTTTGSGVLFDSIRHGTPIMLPEYVETGREIPHVVRYDGTASGLGSVLKSLDADRERVRRLTDMARGNAESFTVERQAQRFQAIYDDITNDT